MKPLDNIFRTIMVTLFLCSGLYSYATPMLIEWQDGTAGRLFEGWSAQVMPLIGSDVTTPGLSALAIDTDSDNTGVTVDGNLTAIEVAGTSGSLQSDLYYTTAFGALDLGNYAGISFDFYAEDASEVQNFGIYFQTTASDQVWYYDIGGASAGWDAYYAQLGTSTGWRGFGLTGNIYNVNLDPSTQFDTALADVDRIGFFIEHWGTGDGTQLYGVDNFGLTVPEPETYMALGMALLGMAFVFRKRITESLDEVRVAIQH